MPYNLSHEEYADIYKDDICLQSTNGYKCGKVVSFTQKHWQINAYFQMTSIMETQFCGSLCYEGAGPVWANS